MLGLKTNTVALYPHSAAWEENAAQTIACIRSVLGDVCADAQHIGSTAIRWISAKPIIDIAVAVRNPGDVMPYAEALAQHGIFYRRVEDTGQLLFLMGDLANDIKTHHIHIVQADSDAWQNYLNFRDYLNAFPEHAREYEAEKIRLQAQYPDDRIAYTDGKQEIISRLLREARLWRAEKPAGNAE